jgi:hypothetical protein
MGRRAEAGGLEACGNDGSNYPCTNFDRSPSEAQYPDIERVCQLSSEDLYKHSHIFAATYEHFYLAYTTARYVTKPFRMLLSASKSSQPLFTT